MGRKVIVVYIWLSYFPQLVAYLIFKSGFERKYNIELEGVLLFCTLLFFVLVFAHYGLNSQAKIGGKKFYISQRVMLVLASIFLAVSLAFYIRFDSNFRHAERVSEGGMLVYALYVMKPICLYIVLRFLYLLAGGEKMTKSGRVSCFIIGVGCVLSATGSFAVLGIAASFIGAFFSAKKISTKVSLKTYLKYSVPVVALAFLIVFTGLSKKVGTEQALNLIFDEKSELVEILILRGSTSFVSGAVMSVRAVQEPLNTDALSGTISTLLYRLNFILPSGIASGQYMETINRLNYEEIDRELMLDRAGASPGLVASFLHLPLFPLSMILLFLYLKVVCSAVDRVAPAGGGRMPVLIVATLSVLLPLFESPLSIFNVLDPVSVTFIILLLGQKIELKNHA